MSVRGKSFAQGADGSREERWFRLTFMVAAAIAIAGCSGGDGMTDKAPVAAPASTAPDVFDVAIPQITSALKAASNVGASDFFIS